MDLKAAGRQLRDMRDARGWSRQRLAELSDVSESAIKNYEEGKRAGSDFTPNRSKLKDLARAFGWADGAQILRHFGEEEMARQLEREAMSDPDELVFAGLRPDERDVVREINRLIVSLVTAER